MVDSYDYDWKFNKIFEKSKSIQVPNFTDFALDMRNDDCSLFISTYAMQYTDLYYLVSNLKEDLYT